MRREMYKGNHSRRRIGLRVLAALALVVASMSAVVSGAGTASAEPNGAPSTPLLGWSSWSYLRYSPTEAKVEAQAKAMSASGSGQA